MSRQSTSLMRSTLAGLCLLVAACGGPVKKSDSSPFHQAAEPTRERDWPLDTEDNGGFVGDSEADSGGDDDDAYEASEDFDSYDDSEGNVGDSLLEDDDVADEGLGDDDFEDDE